MVWDIWVRLGHWAVVGMIVFQFYSGEELDLREVHAWVGAALLSWLVFRLIWGFVGPTHARFSDFLAHPKAIRASFLKLIRREHEPVLGHTAAGGLGVVMLMGLMTLMVATGLISTDDVFYDGPLNHWVSSDTASWATSIHHLGSKLLIAVVVMHVLAIAWHQWVMQERLIGGMVHGRKAGGQGRFDARVGRLGLVCLVLSALLVVGGLGTWGQW